MSTIAPKTAKAPRIIRMVSITSSSVNLFLSIYSSKPVHSTSIGLKFILSRIKNFLNQNNNLRVIVNSVFSVAALGSILLNCFYINYLKRLNFK